LDRTAYRRQSIQPLGTKKGKKMEQNKVEKKKRGCFFYGCGTIICLFIVAAIVGGGVYMYGRSQVDPHCERYLELVKGQKYEEAYKSLAPAWQQHQTFKGFSEFEKAIRDTIGVIQDRTLTGVNLQKTPNGSLAIVVYSSEFSKSKNCTIKFTLSSVNDVWRIQGVNYNSPELNKPLDCSKCGNKVNVFTKFCPKCGNKIQ